MLLEVLPPGKNDRPFRDNFVIWDPMNLVGGSNWSLGSSRFDEISTVALGQCFRMKSWFVDKNPGWKWWQVGKDVVVHVAISCENITLFNKYYEVNSIRLCIRGLAFLGKGST